MYLFWKKSFYKKCHFEGQWWKWQHPDSLVRGMNPRIRTKMSWIRNTGTNTCFPWLLEGFTHVIDSCFVKLAWFNTDTYNDTVEERSICFSHKLKSPQSGRDSVPSLCTNTCFLWLLEGITHVIDSCFVKLAWFNTDTYNDSLIVTEVSQASAEQRAGRAGERVYPPDALFFWGSQDPDSDPDQVTDLDPNPVWPKESLGKEK